MIKINELMVGNFVEYENKSIIVESITETGINLDVVSGSGFNGITFNNETISFKLINPIPLTEEWLLKLGLKKSEDSDYQYGKGYMFTVSHTNKFKEPGVFYEDDTGKSLKYVHQLQNIYFALTEEELTAI